LVQRLHRQSELPFDRPWQWLLQPVHHLAPLLLHLRPIRD
jgi:hypothetical protein